MATQYDGSVNISTKIDTLGFNAGMKKVEATAQKSLGKVTNNITKSMGNVFTSVIGGFLRLVRNIGIGLIGLVGLAVAFGQRMIDSIQQNIDANSKLYAQTQTLREQYLRVQASILSIFSTLLVAALPTIIKIVDWLVRMLDIVNQIIAALTGQKTVQRVVASSVKETADNSGKAAKNAKKMKDEAKGALAAFDQINVLEKKREDDADKGAELGGLQFTEVPIDQKWLTFAEDVKQKWLDMVQAIKDAWAGFVAVWNAFWASPLGQLLQALWQNFIDTWTRIWENTKETLAKIDEGFKRVFTGIGQFIGGILAGDWRRAWEGLKNIIGGVWDIIVALVTGSLGNILIFFDGWKNAIRLGLDFVLNIWRSIWTVIQAFAVGVVKTVQGAWTDFTGWFSRVVINPLRNAWTGLLNWLPGAWQTVLSTVTGIVQGTIGRIINIITSAVNTAIGKVNELMDRISSIRLPELDFGGLGGGRLFGGVRLFGNVPLVPYLATGAVIPPNSQFLAMLGDQKSGTNIEAPEGLIRQILREELGNIKAQIEIEFTGSLASLVRELMPEIKRETVRIGGSAIQNTRIAK